MKRPANIDSPTLEDHLGFVAYASGIARTIRDATLKNQLPLTIGVYGRWGAGKTSLMKMVEAELVPIKWKSGLTDIALKLVPTLGKALISALVGFGSGWLAQVALRKGGAGTSGLAAGGAIGIPADCGRAN